MLIGVPKEVKNHEYRISISPRGVRELTHNGHQVLVEKKAGHAIGFDDAHYQAAGALIIETAEEVFERADMIVKVKEPQAQELSLLREGQILFTYLHLAANHRMADELMKSKCIAISYETVTADDGSLPLLAPMSEIAGRVSVQVGANCLEKANGGRGTLLGGVAGIEPGKVVVLGGGFVGTNAAIIAMGMGAEVTILDNSLNKIRELDTRFGSKIRVIYSTMDSIEEYISKADLVIGAVLSPGAAAPKVVTEGMIKKMQRGSVIVDVAIDQGGCFESSRPTTHDEPTFIYEDVVHYCVTNMPSAVARSSTKALENATLPYIMRLANEGYRTVLKEDKHFRNGLNIYRGRVAHEAVAKELNHPFVPASTFLGSYS